MRKHAIALIAAATVALSAACVVSTSDGEDATLLIVNDSSYVIVDVRISEVGSRSWGPNLLGDVLFPGEELLITDIECGFYDVLVTDDTGLDCVLADIDLCFSDDTWVITNATLDACAFG